MSYRHDLHNDRFYDLIFREKEEGYFVEVGALEGKLCSQTYFLEKSRYWKGIVVEPNPHWTEDLIKNRECHVITNPISDKEEIVQFVTHTKQPEYSKIDDGNPDLPEGEVSSLEMQTKVISKLLDEYSAPECIDVFCVDIEGMELKVLDEVLTNSKRKINLIALEHGDTHSVVDFFHHRPYLKIQNPFLKFVRIDKKREMLVRYSDGDFRYLDGSIYLGSILDLDIINWEYYYIHIDMLSEYPSLKKLIEKVDYFNLNSY